MIRKFLLFMLLLALPAAGFSLGLGKLEVNSSLHEPLDATVELISLNPAEIDGVKASLASAEAFSRAGIERPFFLSKLRFRPVLDQDGRPVLLISSRDTVREPFLNFLLEVRWRANTLQREYTMLFSPKVYRVEQPAAAAPAAPAPKAAIKTPSAPVKKAAQAGTRVRVKFGDTLWVIARDTRPDASVSVEQMAMAYYRGNPAAFINGNINLLRRGAELEVPGTEEIGRSGRKEARREFLAQAAAGATAKSPIQAEMPKAAVQARETKPAPSEAAPETMVQAQQESAAPDAGEKQADEVSEAAPAEADLKVVESSKAEMKGDSLDPRYPVATPDVLEEAISDTEQDLAAVREINQDISELRSMLETKIAVLTQSLKEKDQAIADLQQQLQGGTPLAGAEPEAEVVEAPQPVMAPVVEDAAPEAEPASVATEMPPRPAPVQQAELPEPQFPSLAFWKRHFWITVFAVGVLFILLLILLFGRKKEPEPEDEIPLSRFFEEEKRRKEKSRASAPEVATAIRVEESGGGFDVQDQETPVQDVNSVLTEADIYLAYRRYGHAESLVKGAMQVNPDDPQLKGKLLEIYAFKKDKKAFRDYLEAVSEQLMVAAPDVWGRVQEMGREILPDHPAFRVIGDVADSAAVEPEPELPNIQEPEAQEAAVEEDEELTEEDLSGLFVEDKPAPSGNSDDTDIRITDEDLMMLDEELGLTGGKPASPVEPEPVKEEEGLGLDQVVVEDMVLDIDNLDLEGDEVSLKNDPLDGIMDETPSSSDDIPTFEVDLDDLNLDEELDEKKP